QVCANGLSSIFLPVQSPSVPAGGSWLKRSINMPPERIAGTVGARDAFAAGMLLGLHEDVPINVALTYGVCAAAASLLDPTSSNGVNPLFECLHLFEEFGYRPTLKLCGRKFATSFVRALSTLCCFRPRTSRRS